MTRLLIAFCAALVLVSACGAAGKDLRPLNWSVTLYRDGQAIALDDLAEVHIDTEAGELIAVDHDGYTWTEALGRADAIEVHAD